MNNNYQLIDNYFITHRDELLTYVRARLGGSAEAEDVVQNVFLRLLTSTKLLTEHTLPALAYTIASHLIFDYYRRRTSYHEYEHYIHQVCSEKLSTDSVYSIYEITEQMERGLARLPENCREIYRLHIYDGMKVSEISDFLGDNYKSVEYRLGTARKAMRQYLRAI
ncbi:RNA polymerase sigma factor [Prevotella sp. P6B1]|uniref:RNA polymerase sigma factor n=1 Tax=Prevotella sp. P6B1 TaxID=1410613 RepID=UPI00051C3E0D|nr:sigma-70 family RNA polymerase sigma factor [Prevotella sp. P6B1]